jgi:DNA-binding response OmpR family regulator
MPIIKRGPQSIGKIRKVTLMQIRNFLLVHASRSIRLMIKKHVLAELGDVDFTESDSGHDALRKLSDRSFDLGICDSELGDMQIIDFRQQVMETSSWPV